MDLILKIIMKTKESKKRKAEKESLLTFLKRTQEGRYAKIEESSLPYSRLPIERKEPLNQDDLSVDDIYYYSFR